MSLVRPSSVAAAMGLAILTAGCRVELSTPQAGHPVIGRWSYPVPGTACTEVYEFTQDGSGEILSGESVASRTFRISRQPSAGFYQYEEVMVTSSGSKDCAGETPAPVGYKMSGYLRFTTQNEMYFCIAAVFKDCFGPLMRGRVQPANAAAVSAARGSRSDLGNQAGRQSRALTRRWT